MLQERHAELFATDVKEDNAAHLKMVTALNPHSLPILR
jgi:hypothetical protein